MFLLTKVMYSIGPTVFSLHIAYWFQAWEVSRKNKISPQKCFPAYQWLFSCKKNSMEIQYTGNYRHSTIENNAVVLPHFTSTPSNKKISTPLLRPYSAQFENFAFFVVKMDLWSKFSNFKHLQKINEGTEWSKISIRAVFWHYVYKKRFIFAKFKSCIFEKWPKCGRNLSFFSTVMHEVIYKNFIQISKFLFC